MKGLCNRQCNRCILNGKQCGGCSMCEASICSKQCNRCYALCPERPETMPYIQSIGGVNIELRSNIDFKLPLHVPILPDRLKEPPDHNIMPVIAVHGGNMFAKNGEKINKSYLDRGYVNALNIHKQCRAILEFYVKDRTLEGFWDNRKNIYKELKGMSFLAVIAPNFSVYEDAPRMDHMCNIKRSTIVYNEMIDKGILAIPDISWYSRRDLERWCEAINVAAVKTISFSFQVVDVKLKASSLWKHYLTGFRYVCENIDKSTSILVAGISSTRRIKELFRASKGQNIHILNQAAYVQSRRGMLSENRQENKQLSFDEIFEKNIAYFNKEYDEISSSLKER